MPAPVPYEVFLANVQPADLAMLNAFNEGKRVNALDATEADSLFAEATRLYDAGMIVELHRVYKEVDGVLQQSFDGFPTAVARGYITRLASERAILRDVPLPEPEPQP